MILLAVETSGHEGSVALLTDGDDLQRLPELPHDCGLNEDRGSVVRANEFRISERQLQTSKRRHAQTLVGDADELLRQHQLTPTEISAVAVSIGPGSFTGLRIGLTFAKTFAWVNNAQLTAVETLQAIAMRAPTHLEIVTAIVDAQRGEVFAADYSRDSATGHRERRQDIRIVRPEDLDTRFPLSGPVLVKHGASLAPRYQLLDDLLWSPNAATVAVIGRHQILGGQISDGASLEPVYVRRSYAEEKSRP